MCLECTLVVLETEVILVRGCYINPELYGQVFVAQRVARMRTGEMGLAANAIMHHHSETLGSRTKRCMYISPGWIAIAQYRRLILGVRC